MVYTRNLLGGQQLGLVQQNTLLALVLGDTAPPELGAHMLRAGVELADVLEAAQMRALVFDTSSSSTEFYKTEHKKQLTEQLNVSWPAVDKWLREELVNDNE